MSNIKIENGMLIKNNNVLLKVGEIFTEKLNKYRQYKVIKIDLHFILFEKIKVGDFEKEELGKCTERQASKFLNNDFDMKKC